MGTNRVSPGCPKLELVQAFVKMEELKPLQAPLSISHKTTTRTQVGPYSFPRRSMFMANLSFIMNDPEYFTQPELFKPERLIGPDGT